MTNQTPTQKIHAAADALASAGKRPTLAAIRDAIGGGSFTTISEAMKIWPGRGATTAETDTTPDSISKSGVELATALWKQAKSQADGQLQSEREALDAARADLEQETADAAALADALASENEELKATIERFKSDALQQAKLIAELTTRAAAAEAALVECRARAEQLDGQLTKMEKRAEEATAAAVKAREDAAELRGRLGASQQVKT